MSTSANISGENPPKGFKDISQQIKDAVDYTVHPSMEEKIDALIQAAEDRGLPEQNLDPAPGNKPEETAPKDEPKQNRMGSVFALFGAKE